MNFSFYLLDTFWQNVSKIDSPGGCCSCFRNETSRKIEHMNFLVLLENHGNVEGRGYNFVPEKMFSGIKSDFFLVLLDSRG